VALVALVLAVAGCSSGQPGTAAAPGTSASATAPAADKAFNESGRTFTTAQWSAIAGSGFKLFITDPLEWSSECSDSSCTAPVNTCAIDPAAVTQIHRAITAGLDYAIYTRNPHCLDAAIGKLRTAEPRRPSFVVLDIEPGPSVAPTAAMVSRARSLGETPVVYGSSGSWCTITGGGCPTGSTAFSTLALQDDEVPSWSVGFPAPAPAAYPALRKMPKPYGGWSGYADIEQQQTNTDIAGMTSPADAVDLDAVNAAWLTSLSHQAS